MSITSRLEKFRRFARWRLGSGLPLWWHVGRPNFGDDINPTFFRAVCGRSLRFAADRRRPHLLGAGSILEKATAGSVVCGSGFLEPPRRATVSPLALVAVRGELSLAAFRPRDDVLLGDPLVMVDRLVPASPKRHRFGLVPHTLSVDRWRRRNARGLFLIDPGNDPWKVIGDIAACEVVLSQSLHGLIVADALGVPNVWIAPGDGMTGGRFKFDDYFTTIDRPKACVPETDEVFLRPETFEASVGRYRHSKSDYRRAVVGACERMASGAWAAG